MDINIRNVAVAEKKTSDEIIPFIGDLGIDYDVNSDGVTYTVTGIGTFEGTELIIPYYIRQYKVTAIGDNAFENCTALTKLVIPETIKSIGTRAFYGCSSLTSISIPYSVTSIGMYAFACCSSLTDVYYTGNEESWNKINIDFNNTYLTEANVHFNHRTEE